MKEAALFSDEVTVLRCQLEDCAKSEKDDSDAMYHLQVAQATLKERYSKLQKKNAELQKCLDQTVVKLVNFCCQMYLVTRIDAKIFRFSLV